MSEWITDRKPTAEDADCTRYVWVTTEHGVVLRQSWDMVFGRPWQPIVPPEPYVKPKRYTVKWLKDYQCWAVMDSKFRTSCEAAYIALRMFKLDKESDKYREAAERIAAIYEEVMP